MLCPKCGGKSQVMDSRLSGRVAGRNESNIRRRRRCFSCKFRFTTREVIEHMTRNSDVI